MTKKIFRSEMFSLAEKEVNGNLEISEDIQIFKAGVFSYFEPGDMVLSKEVFAEMIVNFNNKIRGVDIAIDYEHNAYSKAAGWIKELYMNEEQTALFAKVEWTKEAKDKILDKQYRYISGEFLYEYESDNGIKYGPTLFGAALTNRPFLKDMQSVIDMHEQFNQEKIKMDEVKKLNEELSQVKLQLSEKDNEISQLKKDILENEKKAQEEKKTFDFNEMLKEGKVVEAQREAYMKNDVVSFSKLAAPINLSGVGHSQESQTVTTSENNNEDVESKIKSLAEEKMQKENLSWREAVKVVLSENKELAEKYNN